MSSSKSRERDREYEYEGEEENDFETFKIDTNVLFHPGKFLKNRYILLIKIGQGANAEVYLAYDIKDLNNPKKKERFYAIKIQNCESHVGGKREVEFLEEMKQYIISKKINSDDVHINLALDNFVYIDTNVDSKNAKDTTYYCMVFEVYEQSIYNIIRKGIYSCGIDMQYVKKMVKQILISLDFIHNKMGYIHTDIKLENILYCGGNPMYTALMNDWTECSKKINEELIEIKTKFIAKNEALNKEQWENEKAYIRAYTKLNNIYNKEIEDIAVSYLNSIIFAYDFDNDNSDDEDVEYEDDETSKKQSTQKIKTVKAPKEEKLNKRQQDRDDFPSDINVKHMIDMDSDTTSDFVTVPLNVDKETLVPTQTVSTQQMRHIILALTDFGSTRKKSDLNASKREVSPRMIRAPEVIMGLDWDDKIDIWGLGISMFRLITGYELIDCDDSNGHIDIEHLYLIEKQFGKIPTWMIESSPRRAVLFDENRNNHLKGLREFKPYPLKRRLVEQFRVPAEEVDVLWGFLGKLLEIDPKKRASAQELLDDPWINNSDWLRNFSTDAK